MQNRFKHWRHRCEMEREDFAAFIGVPYHQYTRYENQKVQPNLKTLHSAWLKLKVKFPDINLQDLLEDESQITIGDLLKKE